MSSTSPMLRWMLLFPIALAVGCNGGLFDSLPPNPFSPPVQTSYVTPSKKIAQIKALRAEVELMSDAEQERMASELARQVAAEEDAQVREQIIRTLATYDKSPTAAQVVRAGLKDADPDVRLVCCRLTARTRGPQAVAALGEVLQSDTDFDVRMAAARGLGDQKDPAATAALAVALEDPSPAMQFRAVAALKDTTGRDLGNDVDVWRQYVKGETPTAKPVPAVASQLRNLWPF